VEVAELIEGDLWPALEEHEPPRVSAHCGETDISADDHVAKEQPAIHEWLISLARGTIHDIVVLGVEAERRGWESVSHQVYPEQLHRN